MSLTRTRLTVCLLLHRAALAWRGPSATTNFPKDNYDLAAIASDIELSRDGPQPNGRGSASRITRRSKNGGEHGNAKSSKGNAADHETVRCAFAAVHEPDVGQQFQICQRLFHLPGIAQLLLLAAEHGADVLMSSCKCPAGRRDSKLLRLRLRTQYLQPAWSSRSRLPQHTRRLS